jgi:hypothetical protein
MGLGKLIKTVRTISVYKKTRGKHLGDLIEEFNVDAISIEELKKIITPNNDDPLLFDGYPLNDEELQKLSELLENKIIPNHKRFDYVLECYGIYDKVN